MSMQDIAPYRSQLLDAGFSSHNISMEGTPPIFWLCVGKPARTQGWKLHISSRSDRVAELLACISPVLRDYRATFKVVASSAVARAINGGKASLLQVGKILTIYPVDDYEAVELGEILINLLEGFPGPIIDNELRLAPNAPIYIRYGAFLKRSQQTKLGIRMITVEDAEGKAVPDLRAVPMHQVLGIKSPFPSAFDSSLGPLLEQRFLIVGPLVKTGHSTVAIGVDLDKGIQCALKVVKRHAAIDRLNRDAVDRLKHEWKLLCFLQGVAAVPEMVACLEDENHAILVMEYIQGETLLHYVRTKGSILMSRQGKLAKLVIQLITVVQEIHEAGVILGDLTPTNIMVNASGTLKIVDFESAFRTDQALSLDFGTQGYTDPAVLAGMPPSYAHDLYSLAAIIYYLVTGTDLSRIPQHELLLRSGNMLVEPWKRIVASLVDANPSKTMAVLSDTKQALMALSDSPDSFGVGIATSGLLDFSLAQPAPLDVDELSITKLIEDLGVSIASLADWTSDGLGIWTSQHPVTRGEKHRDLYMGDAGIAFGLLRIGLSTGRLELIEVAVKAAERLWASRSDDHKALPGLFIGEAGPGLLFLTLSEILGDSMWLSRAVEFSRRIASMDYDSPDMLHGAAGRGLFHTWVYRYSSETEDLNAALAVFDYLASTCERTPLGPLWRIPEGYGGLEYDTCYGIAHGSAGIGYFLAELISITQIDSVTSLLRDIGHSLQQAGCTNSLIGMLDWPDKPNGAFRGGAWCHGSAGIALTFLRMYRAMREDVYLTLAIQAAESALKRAHHLGPTQCHGLAGLLEVYLDLFAETADERQLRAAQCLGERLQTAFVIEGAIGPMVCSENPDVLTAEFMVGSAGAAAALARLHQPERFGHFLRSPQQAFRPHTIA